jgi:hypothetical protein
MAAIVNFRSIVDEEGPTSCDTLSSHNQPEFDRFSMRSADDKVAVRAASG